MYSPKEIITDPDKGISIASFPYYTGIEYAAKKNLKQAKGFGEVINGTHFIVCCGDVMLRVEDSEFPHIKRRILV